MNRRLLPSEHMFGRDLFQLVCGQKEVELLTKAEKISEDLFETNLESTKFQNIFSVTLPTTSSLEIALSERMAPKDNFEAVKFVNEILTESLVKFTS